MFPPRIRPLPPDPNLRRYAERKTHLEDIDPRDLPFIPQYNSARMDDNYYASGEDVYNKKTYRVPAGEEDRLNKAFRKHVEGEAGHREGRRGLSELQAGASRIPSPPRGVRINLERVASAQTRSPVLSLSPRNENMMPSSKQQEIRVPSRSSTRRSRLDMNFDLVLKRVNDALESNVTRTEKQFSIRSRLSERGEPGKGRTSVSIKKMGIPLTIRGNAHRSAACDLKEEPTWLSAPASHASIEASPTIRARTSIRRPARPRLSTRPSTPPRSHVSQYGTSVSIFTPSTLPFKRGQIDRSPSPPICNVDPATPIYRTRPYSPHRYTWETTVSFLDSTAPILGFPSHLSTPRTTNTSSAGRSSTQDSPKHQPRGRVVYPQNAQKEGERYPKAYDRFPSTPSRSRLPSNTSRHGPSSIKVRPPKLGGNPLGRQSEDTPRPEFSPSPSPPIVGRPTRKTFDWSLVTSQSIPEARPASRLWDAEKPRIRQQQILITTDTKSVQTLRASRVDESADFYTARYTSRAESSKRLPKSRYPKTSSTITPPRSKITASPPATLIRKTPPQKRSFSAPKPRVHSSADSPSRAKLLEQDLREKTVSGACATRRSHQPLPPSPSVPSPTFKPASRKAPPSRGVWRNRPLQSEVPTKSSTTAKVIYYDPYNSGVSRFTSKQESTGPTPRILKARPGPGSKDDILAWISGRDQALHSDISPAAPPTPSLPAVGSERSHLAPGFEAMKKREAMREPVPGGRSKNAQLGSVEESWGPRPPGLGPVYGMFEIEKDPPSRAQSPFRTKEQVAQEIGEARENLLRLARAGTALETQPLIDIEEQSLEKEDETIRDPSLPPWTVIAPPSPRTSARSPFWPTSASTLDLPTIMPTVLHQDRPSRSPDSLEPNSSFEPVIRSTLPAPAVIPVINAKSRRQMSDEAVPEGTTERDEDSVRHRLSNDAGVDIHPESQHAPKESGLAANNTLPCAVRPPWLDDDDEDDEDDLIGALRLAVQRIKDAKREREGEDNKSVAFWQAMTERRTLIITRP
ncbi:hypothetical protein P7C73_g6279, partial [Tremellales sp. Uapishka_1]